jgi:hypothetical protein
MEERPKSRAHEAERDTAMRTRNLGRGICLVALLAAVLGGIVRWGLVGPGAGVAAPLAAGRVFYVDPGGSDAGGTGSASAPWQTIQRAANAVAPGDTVMINPGTYAGGVTIDTGGTAAAPISFRGNGPGVVVQGSGAERDALFVTYADWVVIEGLTVRQATRAGLRIDFSHHVTVRNSVFADNGTWGVFTDFSDYTLIESSELYGSVEEHGIYVSNSSDHPTIRGNRIHHNHANGLHMNGDLSMGGDGTISWGLVENNVIWENGAGGGSGVNMDGVTDTIVRNNLLYDNHAGGVAIYQIDGAVCSRDNRILNNTIVLAGDGRWAVNVYAGCTGNKVFNNVLYTAHSWRGSIVLGAAQIAGFESDYNVVMDRFSTDGGNTRVGLAAWQGLGYDLHSRIATPAQLFVSPGAKDFHLRAGSPAIDAGTTVPDVSRDLEENSRPRGAAFDVGAYESGAGAPPPTATLVPTATPLPTATATATAMPTAKPGKTWKPFADDFESGNLSVWNKSSGLVVQDAEAAGGTWAARATGARTASYASKTFSAPQAELWVRVRVAVLGPTPSGVTLLQVRTAKNVVLVGLIREADGRLAVAAEGTGTVRRGGPVLAQDSGWHEVVIRVRTGAATEVEVWVDEVRVTALSGPLTLASTNPIGRFQLGENARKRTFDLGFDDVAVDVVRPPALGSVAPLLAASEVDASELAPTSTLTPTLAPTLTPTPEATSPPTVTPEVPTATVAPPPTATSEPPAVTETPTEAPVPPTDTPAPPTETATPVPPPPTEAPSPTEPLASDPTQTPAADA